MTPMRFPVSVIVQRIPLSSRWVSERWDPVAVEPASDETMGVGPLQVSDNGAASRWRFGGYAIELHKSEAEGYFLNTSSPEPKVFVMWRPADDGATPPIRPEVVTVSYNEAARLMDGGERVDAVPMPTPILAWLTPFVALHYKPEPKRKVRRNDPFADPDAGGDRGRQR
jgi:hypothetical protein